MKPADRALVLALAAILLLMLLIVAAPGPGAPAAVGGPAGEPRDLDVDLLRHKILTEELSDQEALYYHRD